MLKQKNKVAHAETRIEAFGRYISSWRGTVKRPKVLAHLPGWTNDTLYRLEIGTVAPAFDDLAPLYRALWLAGATIPFDGPQLFLGSARMRSERKQTHRDIHSESEWKALLDDLIRIDSEFRAKNDTSVAGRMQRLLLLDTSHLISRDWWRNQVHQQVNGPQRKKVIVVAGPSGIGKTSELSALASYVLSRNSHRPIFCDFRMLDEQMQSPEEALRIFMGTTLSALGYTGPQSPPSSVEEGVWTLVEQIEHSSLPVLLLVDHAERILQQQGMLASCWERFLVQFLRTQHTGTLVLATKQWSPWFSGESHFLGELPLPPLSQDQGVALLRQLGLESVPQPLLCALHEKVKGIPVCLEWLAALARQPLPPENDAYTPLLMASNTPPVDTTTRAVQGLLAEPYIFAGLLADDIAPVLERRILADYRLSPQAYRLLQLISLSTIPLATPALDALYPDWRRSLSELRKASLLVAYYDRFQALPSVASALIRGISAEQRYQQEEMLIRAYQSWLQQGLFLENEKGAMVAALARLQLLHGHLLSAAELLIRHGWMAFHLGYAVRLAQLAQSAIVRPREGESADLETPSEEAGTWLLHYFLSPYLGKKIDVEARARHYSRLLQWIIERRLTVEPTTQLFVVRHLMFWCMDHEEFLEAQALVDSCEARLGLLLREDLDLQASLLEKRGFLLTRWCEYAVEQQDDSRAQALREEAIAVYRKSVVLLTATEEQTPLKQGLLKKRLARMLTNLGFHLSRVGRYDEAVQVLKQSIALKEQGYAEPGSLAASYGDLSQALIGLGHLEEASQYDELAMREITRLADAGDTIQQEASWMYQVNRGRLYVKLGRLDEAEALLQEAISKLPERWRMFRVFAAQTLREIEQQRTGKIAHPNEPLPFTTREDVV